MARSKALRAATSVVQAVVAQTQIVVGPGVPGIQLQGFLESGDGFLVFALAIEGQGRVLVEKGQSGGDAVLELAQFPGLFQRRDGAVVVLQLGVGLAQEIESLGVGSVDGGGVLELYGGVAVVFSFEQLVADAVVHVGLLSEVVGEGRTSRIEALGAGRTGLGQGGQGDCEEEVVSQAQGSLLVKFCSDFFLCGKASFLQFGKHQVAIDNHLETSAVRGHQGELGHVLFALVEDVLRQTDGLFEVASSSAVCELYSAGHVSLPPMG